MKSTDLARKERELRRARKKEEILHRKGDKRSDMTVGDYIKSLSGLFFHDTEKIYNVADNEDILELLENMQVEIPEKQWDNILKKAVRETKVKQKEEALKVLYEYLE